MCKELIDNMIENVSIFGESLGEGLIKQQPQDFQVKERIKFVPEGSGDHLYIYVEKTNANTEWVQKQLADAAGISPRDVGYAGLKDRHAITQQWFSVYAPNDKVVDFSRLPDDIKIIEQTRGLKKLKTAAVADNEFLLRIRFNSGVDRRVLESRLQILQKQGFPNFFGLQRFGIEGRNIAGLLGLAKGKRCKPQQRGLYISSGRSYLFNQILNERVRSGMWNQFMDGDVVLLANTRSIFPLDKRDENMQLRLTNFDVHPALPLYGLGDWPSDSAAKQLEQTVFNSNEQIVAALEKLKVEMMPRASRVCVKDMHWNIAEEFLDLGFVLPSGAYATTLLAQLFEIKETKTEQM